jgi:hypothetical protein
MALANGRTASGCHVLVVEGPASEAREVAVVGLLGLEVEVLEQQGHVVPVLHEEDVGLVGDHQLDR